VVKDDAARQHWLVRIRGVAKIPFGGDFNASSSIKHRQPPNRTTQRYLLQQSALNMLGRLHVSEAKAALQEVLAQNADANLTVAACDALEEIARVEK